MSCIIEGSSGDAERSETEEGSGERDATDESSDAGRAGPGERGTRNRETFEYPDISPYPGVGFARFNGGSSSSDSDFDLIGLSCASISSLSETSL